MRFDLASHITLQPQQIRGVAVALLVLFTISLSMPAQSDQFPTRTTSGGYAWMMSLWVVTIVLEALMEGALTGLWLAYIASLGLFNFVILWALVRMFLDKRPGVVLKRTVNTAAVFAWLALIIPFGDLEPFHIGYYVWAAVFTLTALIVHLRRRLGM
jgi:hypothetical protein